jgi:hypothetical protein
VSHSVTVSLRGCPRLEYPSPTLCQSRRHSVAAELFTIQSFSRACPIGHALDISFENWTSSLRIYNSCRYPNRVSSPSSLTCSDASCLTRCHPASVSVSCHFSDNGAGAFRHSRLLALIALPLPLVVLRHVTAQASPGPFHWCHSSTAL